MAEEICQIGNLDDRPLACSSKIFTRVFAPCRLHRLPRGKLAASPQSRRHRDVSFICLIHSIHDGYRASSWASRLRPPAPAATPWAGWVGSRSLGSSWPRPGRRRRPPRPSSGGASRRGSSPSSGTRPFVLRTKAVLTH